ncbi:AraC-type DNA-binding protein [Verrucomicrobium sp. GAS474]|uniref:helix-turn-helix transcriptional regulator n=1 Tax=Verrucomicrobium sp. GAS474 TaxID=1882831 RepID=UPI00087D3803|nr:AraC family transcriptional regulator [Verrucomicrobium sp. GAS474]SDU30716.1 AraC-type DNA-binding protein [Verrucomicrobium sp. GAS474]
MPSDTSFHRAAARDEAALRRETAALLGRWAGTLQRGRLRSHLPRRAGLMRFAADMPFHLKPELFLQVSGSTTFTFPEQRIRVGPGELCLVPSGLPHRERGRDDVDGTPFCNLVFAYQEGEFRFHLARLGKGGKPFIAIASRAETGRPADAARLALLLEPLPDWGEEKGRDWEWAVRGALLAHLALLGAALRHAGTVPAVPTEPLRVAQVRRLVMQNLARPELSVGWIARTLQSSPDYLSRLFRSVTGIALASYLDTQRMAQARALLETSTENIAQVARACGYDDPGYFSRRFRKSQGVTPRAYRRAAGRR